MWCGGDVPRRRGFIRSDTSAAIAKSGGAIAPAESPGVPSSGQQLGSSMRGQSRGQTTLDFAFGMSIFLAVVLFIFMFVPGILDPFTAGVQSETVTTNRVADELTHGLLGDTARPKVLNRTCTVRFFDGRAPETCNYYGGSDVQERVGVGELQNVNVTIYGNVSASGSGRDVLCWDDGAKELAEVGGGGTCTVDFRAGGSPPRGTGDSVAATRVASLYREDVTLEVVMW